MSDLLQRFDKKREFLVAMPYRDAGPRLCAFLNWMESQTEIKTILVQIGAQVDIHSITAGCGHDNPPEVATREEMAALGLSLMEKCREVKDLHHLARRWGIMRLPPFAVPQMGQNKVDNSLP